MIVGLVPNSLILAIVLAYALGAVRMAGKGALIQEANAVESLSNVDVLCTDKTGTLTTNVIRLHELEPLEAPRDELERLLAAYAASTAVPNRTIEALAAGLPGARSAGRPTRRPSRRIASGAAWPSPTAPCPTPRWCWARPRCSPRACGRRRRWPSAPAAWSAAGLRVLLLAGTRPHGGLLRGRRRPRRCRPASCRSAS